MAKTRIPIDTPSFADLMTFSYQFADKTIVIRIDQFLSVTTAREAVDSFMQDFAVLTALEHTLFCKKETARSVLSYAKFVADGVVRSDWDADANGKMTEAGVTARVAEDPEVLVAAATSLQQDNVHRQVSGLLNAARVKYDALTERIYHQ